MQLVLTKLNDCGGCRWLVVGPDGAGVHAPETACGNCERNPRLVTFLHDNKEKPPAPPTIEIPPVPEHEGLSALQKANEAEAAEWGLSIRKRAPDRRK